MTTPLTPRHATPTRIATVLATALVVAGAAGCTGKSTSTSTATTTTTTTGRPSPTAVTLPSEPPFVKSSFVGAIVDVKILDCPTSAGNQTAKLQLTNSSKSARDYAIQVFWLKNDSGTPLGAALLTEKNVAPGKKVELTAKAKVLDGAERCALNVKAGKLK